MVDSRAAPNDWRVRAAAAADIPPASAAGHFVVGPSVATEAAALDEPFEHRQPGPPAARPDAPQGASPGVRPRPRPRAAGRVVFALAELQGLAAGTARPIELGRCNPERP